jgi:hypothetical protein
MRYEVFRGEFASDNGLGNHFSLNPVLAHCFIALSVPYLTQSKQCYPDPFA